MLSDEFRSKNKPKSIGDAEKADVAQLWHRWRMSVLFCGCALLVLVCANLWKQHQETSDLKKITAPSPQALFEQIYPDGLFLGELSNGQDVFSVGTTKDRETVCWLLEETEAGWHIEQELRSVRTLKHEFLKPRSARAYSCRSSELDVLVIIKHLLKEDSLELLGSEPSDSLGSVFSLAIDENPVSTTYYYFTAVDCDSPNYSFVAW